MITSVLDSVDSSFFAPKVDVSKENIDNRPKAISFDSVIDEAYASDFASLGFWQNKNVEILSSKEVDDSKLDLEEDSYSEIENEDPFEIEDIFEAFSSDLAESWGTKRKTVVFCGTVENVYLNGFVEKDLISGTPKNLSIKPAGSDRFKMLTNRIEEVVIMEISRLGYKVPFEIGCIVRLMFHDLEDFCSSHSSKGLSLQQQKDIISTRLKSILEEYCDKQEKLDAEMIVFLSSNPKIGRGFLFYDEFTQARLEVENNTIHKRDSSEMFFKDMRLSPFFKRIFIDSIDFTMDEYFSFTK